MATEKQIFASQRNGAKSRGPVTVEGRLRASQNARTHGLLAEAVLIDGEQAAAFDDLKTCVLADFSPTSFREHQLADLAIQALWRLHRIWEMESAIFNDELRKQPEGLPAQRAGRAFSELANKTRSLDLLNRYDSRFERQYHRALNQLRREREAQRALSGDTTQGGDFPERWSGRDPFCAPCSEAQRALSRDTTQDGDFPERWSGRDPFCASCSEVAHSAKFPNEPEKGLNQVVSEGNTNPIS